MSKKIEKLIKYARGSLSVLLKNSPLNALKKLSSGDIIVKFLQALDFKILVNLYDNAIARPLLLTECYEPHVTKTILTHLKKNTHFLDIGANIGFFSLLAARHCPEGKVFSFEPDSENFKLFKASIILNGFDSRIQAYPFAVSHTNETLIITDLGNKKNSGARFTGKSEAELKNFVHGQNPEYKEVRAVCLDSFLENEKIDLIKIDIEGFEFYAFQGMRKILEVHRPAVISEFAPGNLVNIGKTDPVQFLNFFTGLSYQIHIIHEDGSIENCGKDIPHILEFIQNEKKHHLDLLFTPQ